LIGEIELIREYQGSPVKKPTQIELDNGHELSFRRAVYPRQKLAAGTIITHDMLTVLRPNHGIDARMFDQVIGKKLKVDVKEHQKLEWDLFE
jgi:N-acetylneuraminate synthase/N,N'-diacetyllegionaminate synthase